MAWVRWPHTSSTKKKKKKYPYAIDRDKARRRQYNQLKAAIKKVDKLDTTNIPKQVLPIQQRGIEPNKA